MSGSRSPRGAHDGHDGHDAGEAPAAGTGRRGPGRPLLLTEQVAERICAALRAGNSRACAAAMGGVCQATLRSWLQRARRGDEAYTAFYDRVELAVSGAESDAVARVRAGETGWQGAAWWLERHPQVRNRWRRPIERVEADVVGQLAKLLGDDDRAENWLVERLAEVRARISEQGARKGSGGGVQ